jgi:hypothetical protein
MSAFTTGHKSCVKAMGIYCARNKSGLKHPKVETIAALAQCRHGRRGGDQTPRSRTRRPRAWSRTCPCAATTLGASLAPCRRGSAGTGRVTLRSHRGFPRADLGSAHGRAATRHLLRTGRARGNGGLAQRLKAERGGRPRGINPNPPRRGRRSACCPAKIGTAEAFLPPDGPCQGARRDA